MIGTYTCTYTDADLQEFRRLVLARERGEPFDQRQALLRFAVGLAWLRQVGHDIHRSGVEVTAHGREHLTL